MQQLERQEIQQEQRVQITPVPQAQANTVTVMIMRQHQQDDPIRVLLLQRSLASSSEPEKPEESEKSEEPAYVDPFAGEWELPGGHAEAGEEPFEAALREIQEETGLALEQLKLRGFSHYVNSEGCPAINWIYTATIEEPPLVILSSEHRAATWKTVRYVQACMHLAHKHDAILAFLAPLIVGNRCDQAAAPGSDDCS